MGNNLRTINIPLKKCSCGGDAGMAFISMPTDKSLKGKPFVAMCLDCFKGTPHYRTAKEAADAWNMGIRKDGEK